MKAQDIIEIIDNIAVMSLRSNTSSAFLLQSLVYMLQQAYNELGLLFLLVAVAIILYTSLIFAIEREGPLPELWSFYDSF